MNDAELSVDGELVDLSDTVRLFQQKPFPGGHVYRLVVSGPVADRFTNINEGTDLSPEDQQVILWEIERLCAGLAGESKGRAHFILNSVNHVWRSEGGITIVGACSTPVDARTSRT